MKVLALFFATLLLSCSFASPNNSHVAKMRDSVQLIEEKYISFDQDQLQNNMMNLMKKLASGAVKAVSFSENKEKSSVENIVNGLDTKALMLVIGGEMPESRDPDTDFISVEVNEYTKPLLPFVAKFDQMAKRAETTLGKVLPAITIGTLYLEDSPVSTVLDLSSGRLLLTPQVLSYLHEVKDLEGALEFFDQWTNMVVQIFETYEKERKDGSTTELSTVFAREFARQVPTLLKQNPLWFCITCVVVLSLGIPLVFNYFVGELAVYICEYLGYSASVCSTDAILLVLVLGNALLPVFAYAIYEVCGLASCAQHNAVELLSVLV